MTKAELERELKRNAAGKSLKTVRVLDATSGEEFNVKSVSWDADNDVIFIHVE